jgi:unsaturated rhamnogalacturonyl hydrolase
MKKFIVVFTVWMLLVSSVLKSEVFNADEIVKRMEKAAAWQFDNPVRYGDLEWHGAPFYMGLTDLYEITGKETYLEYVKNIGIANSWNIGHRPYHADDHAVGLSYIKLFQKYKDRNDFSCSTRI